MQRFVGERDFVSRFLLPQLEKAAVDLGVSDVVDFFVDKRVDGFADLVAERAGQPLFVVEAKFKKKVGAVERDIEPRDPDVIGQAVQYAALGGFPFYATCNAKRLILFQHKIRVKAFESEVASYDYAQVSDWAKSLLETSLGLVPVRLKPLDDSLVDTLHEAFNDLYPEFLSSLRDRLQEKVFKERFVEWLGSQGLEPSDETNRLLAAQLAYMELNKFLFYHVVQQIYPERLKPLRIEESEDVGEALSGFYKVVREIDYAPIYEHGLLGEISLTRRAEVRIRTLLDTLGEFDFSSMGSDFLGRIYEKLIPADERKRLGQFYTPSGIVDFITRLTVQDKDAVVLDPGCGSGSFLVRAYHRLRELKGYPRDARGMLAYTIHQELLDQVYGIDINPFPAHLSVINLAIQNPRARIKTVNVLVEDFFNIKPGITTLTGFKSFTAEGSQSTVTLPPFFDAIVANPPYIRQELLGESEKETIRELIEKEYSKKLFIGSASREAKDVIVLNKQSDIYIYFFIHGLKLLRDGGRLGFISSNKWLEVAYGEPFQQFLRENTNILYIVEFDRAVFPDAEVNTAVTILEKEKSKSKRDSNVVKFVRVKKKLDMDTLLQLITDAKESYEDDNIRINLVKQDQLALGKWNIYLRAPIVFQKILTSSKIKPLGSLSQVFRGPVTGYNDYFILSREKAREWEIEPKFLRLCVSSPKKIRGLVIQQEEDIDEFFFMVNQAKDALRGTNALKYIEHGEKLEIEVTRGSQRGKRKLPQLQTVSSRKLWYAIPQLQIAPILFQYMIDLRAQAFWNQAEAHAPNIIHYIIPNKETDTLPLLGYLNSSLNALLVELYGRSYGGGVLKIEVYELKELPVIDPSTLSDKERKRIEKAFLLLVDTIDNRIRAKDDFEKVKSKGRKNIGLFEDTAKKQLNEALEKEGKAREQLDEAIYDILGLTSEERRQVKEGLRELQEIRRLRTKT